VTWSDSVAIEATEGTADATSIQGATRLDAAASSSCSYEATFPAS